MAMDDASKMYHVRKTIIEMLADRGYMVTEAEQNLTLEAFMETFCRDGTPE